MSKMSREAMMLYVWLASRIVASACWLATEKDALRSTAAFAMSGLPGFGCGRNVGIGRAGPALKGDW